MTANIFPISNFNPQFNDYLPYNFEQNYIYQSIGLKKHIEKRHPECLPYLHLIPAIIESPDYIGVNPNEPDMSMELVKILDNNIQLGIKLDVKNNYLYIATLHTITMGKLKHGIENGRLKKFDKNA